MNIAAKITSLTDANKVSIGENVYKSLDSSTKSEFSEISLSDNRWKYINYGTDRPYKVYTLNHWKPICFPPLDLRMMYYAIYSLIRIP